MDRRDAFIFLGHFGLFCHLQFHVDVTVRYIFFGLVFAEQAELELAVVRYVQTIHVLFQLATCKSLVVIRCHYVVVGIQHVHTHDAQATGTALVEEFGGECSRFVHFQVQDNVLHVVTIEAQFVDTFRNVCQSFPVGRVPSTGQHFVGTNLVLPCHIHFSGLYRYPIVITCLYISGCVDTCRSFQTGKDTAAGNHGTTGVTHHFRHCLSILVVHVVNHRHDGVHGHVFLACEVQFRTEVVRTVTQYGTPYDVQVSVCKVGLNGMAIEFLRTLYGILVAFQRHGLYTFQLHVRSQYFGTVTQSDLEDFRTRLQSQFRCSGKHQLTVLGNEFGSQQVVAERKFAVLFCCQLCLSRLFFLREDDGCTRAARLCTRSTHAHA